MKALTLHLLLTLMLLAGLTSCGDTEDVVVSGVSDPQVAELVQESDELTFLITTQRILRSAAQRDREQIEGTLSRIKTASMLLDANPQDRSALMSLRAGVEFYSNIIVSERDQPRINKVFDKGRSLLVKYANLQGVPLEDLQWRLFSYRFSEDVSPFGSSDTPIDWSIRFVQQDRYAISARGRNKSSVLLTPTFDLSNVKNPAYSIRHMYQVEEGFPPKPTFDRSLILNTAFRVYVSTTYKDGDEPRFSNRRQWTRVGLGRPPLGLNFHTTESGIISLKEFEGKKITMAFVFTNNEEIQNHQLSWAIERFELHGVSEKLNYKARPVPFDPSVQDGLGKNIWKYDFPSNLLDGVTQVTLSGDPADFRLDGERGNIVRAGNRDTVGEKLLYTNTVVDLSKVEFPFIRIKHTINHYDQEFQDKFNVRLVVAEDEPGKDPKDFNWIRVPFEKNNPPGSNWNVYVSEFAPIPAELSGKKIRVGWYHKSEGKSSPSWQVHFTELRNISELAE